MMRMCLSVGSIALALVCVANRVVGAPPAIALEKTFVRGVYYGLDPNAVKSNAEKAGKDVPSFLNQLFRDLRHTYHCNLFWSNSGGVAEHRQAMDIAARHDLNIVGWDMSYICTPMDTESKMEAMIKRTVDAYKDKKACAGYVVCEETCQGVAPQMEYYRRLLKGFDPSRPGILVENGGYPIAYAQLTHFPIICSEGYFWGGPNAPYCPNTPERSSHSYATALDGHCNMARKAGKIAWIMTQAATVIDGKTWTDDAGNLMIEPGGSWANRMPNPNEIRFQIWDAIRAGCRGVIFFMLMDTSPDWRPDKPNLSEAEKKWGEEMDKRVVALKSSNVPLVKVRTNTGEPAALLQKGGGPTRQSRAMGETFAVVEKFEPLIGSWKQADFPVVFAEHPAGVKTFESADQPGRRFVVVVNQDTTAKRDLRLLFAPNVTRATDLRSGKAIALKPSVNDPAQLFETTTSFDAGDGTILELAFADARPGVLLSEEDFARFGSSMVLENVERINFPGPFAQGDYWCLRKTHPPVAGGARAEGYVNGKHEGVSARARLINLQEVAWKNGPLGGSLALADKGKCDVLLAVEGTFPKPESLVIETVNKDGGEAWLRSDGHYHPVRIPARDAAGKEIVEVRFLLSDDAMLTGIRCWRIGKTP